MRVRFFSRVTQLASAVADNTAPNAETDMNQDALKNELERSERNAKQLAALLADNDRSATEVAAALGAAPLATSPAPAPHTPRPPYAMRG